LIFFLFGDGGLTICLAGLKLQSSLGASLGGYSASQVARITGMSNWHLASIEH
jgi:hypothetical protein